jgi:hypothetical protein
MRITSKAPSITGGDETRIEFTGTQEEISDLVALAFPPKDRVIHSGIRASGTRLEPGELGEIMIAAQAGQMPTTDQVLGLIELNRSLAGRLHRRYAEVLELRAQVSDTGFLSRTVDLERELERCTQERDEREAARASLERQLTVTDANFHLEQERADQNKAWAERAEAQVKDVDRDRMIERDRHHQAAQRLEKIRDIADRQTVSSGLNTHAVPDYVKHLQTALRDIRAVFDDAAKPTQ